MSVDVEAAPDVETAQPSASEQLQVEALAQVDITGHPTLRPVGTYRVKERNALMAEVQRITKFNDQFNDQGDDQGDDVELDIRKLKPIEEIDTFLESVSVDPAAYAVWATPDGGGPDLDQRIVALFGKFVDQLGKSMSSAS